MKEAASITFNDYTVTVQTPGGKVTFNRMGEHDLYMQTHHPEMFTPTRQAFVDHARRLALIFLRAQE